MISKSSSVMVVTMSLLWMTIIVRRGQARIGPHTAVGRNVHLAPLCVIAAKVGAVVEVNLRTSLFVLS